MRFETVLLALPALAAAQQQIPLLDQLQGYYKQASAKVADYLPKAPPAPVAPNAPKVTDMAASAISAAAVERLTLDNYNTVLKAGAATSSPGIEEWLIFVTGGNKSCFGLCQYAETEFNKSVPFLEASRNAPHLGMISCETDAILCNAWALGPPSLIHMLIPQPLEDQSMPATTVRSIPLNRTSVTAHEIAAIHTEEKYKELKPYDGFWHPFDGPLAKFGLNIPIGYAIWGFSQIPSWMFMIGVSFLSRSIMSKRMGGGAPAAA